MNCIHTILLLLLSLYSVKAVSQNKISSYRYWFDNQYGNAVKTNITPAQQYTLSTQVNTTNLLNGLHLFNINFTDDSARVSPTLSSFFYKTAAVAGGNNITAYQYWYDNDIANAVTQPVTALPAYSLISGLNTVNLLPGLHVLQVRFKDNHGGWSSAIAHFFYKSLPAAGGNAIIAFQYWFDENHAAAVQQTIAPGTTYTLSTPVNAATLLDGLHTLHVRFLDNHQQWSSTNSQFFYKQPAGSNNTITRFQYWFDQDFAGAVQQSIAPSVAYNLSQQLTAVALHDGLHAISVRFSDEKGKWSSTNTQFFYKEQPDTVTQNTITAYRYWFDEGDSSLNLVDIVPFINTFTMNQQIAADGMDSGQHILHFQFKDVKGNWSMVTSDSTLVTVKTIYTFNGNGNWSNAANWANKIKPPLTLSGTYNIFIDPVAGGRCILDVTQHITSGAVITVRSGKSFVVPGNLIITH
ncbi:MAG: hypothetical protein IPP72_14815 [Chitinophagaceae bacterium]|nr:hypothetical protein [Chitinophagaceae bacterium]